MYRYVALAIGTLAVASCTLPRLHAQSAEAEWQDSSGAAPFSIPLLMDAGGLPLDGATHSYTITLAADELPPARSWSLALYRLPEQHFVANALHRHAIESGMLRELVQNSNGSFTIYIQRDPPRGKWKANWLPAADGPFMMQLHLDDPEQRVLDAAWQMPPVIRAD